MDDIWQLYMQQPKSASLPKTHKIAVLLPKLYRIYML